MDVSVTKWLALILFVGGVLIFVEGAWSYSRTSDEHEQGFGQMKALREEARYDPLYQDEQEQAEPGETKGAGESVFGYLRFMFTGPSARDAMVGVLCIVASPLMLILGPRVVKMFWPDPPPAQSP